MRARNTTALCALVAATFAVGAKTALAEMPAAIVAPDATPIVTLHAEGAQIYECKTADDGKLAWAFREPIATLILDGKTVGRHYAGPIWEYVDGSSVHGKAVANAPGATGNDVAVAQARGDRPPRHRRARQCRFRAAHQYLGRRPSRPV